MKQGEALRLMQSFRFVRQQGMIPKSLGQEESLTDVAFVQNACIKSSITGTLLSRRTRRDANFWKTSLKRTGW